MEPSSLLERFYLNNCRKIFNKFLEINVGLRDVTLMGDDGTCVKCHSFVLSACSPFFDRAFTNVTKVNNSSESSELVILLATYKAKNVQRMVDYIYYGKLADEPSDGDTDDNFIRLAIELKIIGLYEALLEKQQQRPDSNHSTSEVIDCKHNDVPETLPEKRNVTELDLNHAPELLNRGSPVEILKSLPEYTNWLRRLSSIRKRYASKNQSLQAKKPQELLNEIIEGIKYDYSNDTKGTYECIAKIAGQAFAGKGSSQQAARTQTTIAMLQNLFHITFDQTPSTNTISNLNHNTSEVIDCKHKDVPETMANLTLPEKRNVTELDLNQAPELLNRGSPVEILKSLPEYTNWLRRLSNVRKRLAAKNQTLQDKKPQELLNEIIEGVKYGYSIDQTGTYECLAKIEGQCFSGKGSTQLAARIQTVKEILQNVFDITFDQPPVTTISEKLSVDINDKFGDIVESLILDKYKNIMSNNPQHFGYKVIAGIVKSVDNDRNNLKVISIGTGSKFLYEKNLNSNGNAVHDTHAEVVARRGLIRYIYNQIGQCIAGNSSNSVFEKADASDKFRLKSGVKFHLYVSTAPCGDARVHSHTNGNASVNGIIPEGQLRTKGQCALTITKDTTSSENVCNVNMSCSAKLLRWNVLGVQGAVLSAFIEPIYLTTMIFGDKFEPKHMKRALYGRIETDGIALPKGFHIIQPELMKVSATKVKSATYSPIHSINWNVQGYDVEILESTSGCTVGKDRTKRYSRISKRAFFSEFIKIARKLNRPQECMYSDAKRNAYDYQVTKTILFQIFENNGLGTWVKKRRRNLDNFTI